MTSPDDLRIGDAEREAATAALREHYAQGRLTYEEFGERLERALSARTGRDLSALGADLPGPLPGGPEGRDTPAGGPWGAEHRHAPHRLRGRYGPHPYHPGRAGPRPPWSHRPRGHGPRALPLLFVALVVTVATAGFWALKFVFAAWLALVVLGMRRHGHRRPRMGRPRRLGLRDGR